MTALTAPILNDSTDAAGATSSPEIRDDIVRLFRRDLVGPTLLADADLAHERLDTTPSKWYLTGFLVPNDDAPETEEDVAEQMALDEDIGDRTAVQALPEDDQKDDGPAKRRFLPASMGLTVMLPPEVTEIEAEVAWGDYRTEPPLPESFLDPNSAEKDDKKIEWVRTPCSDRAVVALPAEGGGKMAAIQLTNSSAEQRPGGCLELRGHWRFMEYQDPDGALERVRILTVFVVNKRPVSRRGYADVSYTFQTTLTLHCPKGFMPRRDYSDYHADDPDSRIADLHYRDVEEYGVGRNAAAIWEQNADNVTWVRTEMFPHQDVPRVAPNLDKDLTEAVEFGMVALNQAASAGSDELYQALARLPDLYDDWVNNQIALIDGLAPRRREVAQGLIDHMRTARDRITDGILLLQSDQHARRAFEIMNRVIEMAARKRDPKVKTWEWRPFQLAFILLNLRGLIDKTHMDRESVDLLFFPTGGGKTEAYLGLAAFAIAHRRLTATGLLGAGVTAIMRYTLRLLTLDQLGRAAGVICALELLRDGNDYRDERGKKMLGDWPIEIGLWVGSAASPNRMGKVKDKDPKGKTARIWLQRYKGGRTKEAPAPIKECPWCRTELTPNSFGLRGPATNPTNLELRCANHDCDFTGDRALPIVVVDDAIYRRLPAFIVATVDKFASLPWEGRVGAFFAHVDRHDEHGFYGAAESDHLGTSLYDGQTLDPPSLIIQDELHLISGPLGTVAGLYEAAIDHLCTRTINNKPIRPKIVASTATVRRAEKQIRALFDRKTTEIFPPPGISREDSFFARTLPIDAENPGRRYLGVAAQGRGPKLLFLRALTTIMAAATAHHDRSVTVDDRENPADPYMTALCYFNALRELGGARRIVEDEVRDRLSRYGSERHRIIPRDAPFADRTLSLPEELTSRVSTDQVAATKKRLDARFADGDEPVDVALATNMISVGLDITRLGLMLVQGQPKTSSEYIQSTSRVGRDHKRPGLVLAILNLHKPRDRMHYEHFGQFHRTFYRSVEATSVTPWATRALDRALAAAVVAIARHVEPELTPADAAGNLIDHADLLDTIVHFLLSRANGHEIPGGPIVLESMIRKLFDVWLRIADQQTSGGIDLKFGTATGGPQSLLHDPLSPALKDLPDQDHNLFVAGRSMRDVEYSVPIRICQPNGAALKDADAS